MLSSSSGWLRVFGGLCVDMWWLVHQWSFLLFWLSFNFFDCFWRLVHCWYSLGRPATIGTQMVLTVFDDWCSVPIVKNSKNDYWCTSRHMSTKTVPTVYQSSRGVGSGEGCSPPQKFFCIFLFQNGDFLCMPVWISVWYFLQFRVMPQAVY